MNTVTRLVLTVTAATALFVPSSVEEGWHTSPPVAETSPPVVVRGFLDAHDAEVAWAQSRFASVGLTLPDRLEVSFHRDREACGGWRNDGLHTKEGEVHRVDVCVLSPDGRKRTLLHELAHAWASRSLDDDQRQAYLVLRELGTWNDQRRLWGERGTEDAAEVFRWGLGGECHLPGKLLHHDVDGLTEAFRWLTGTEPLCDLTAEPTVPAPVRQGGPLA